MTCNVQVTELRKEIRDMHEELVRSNQDPARRGFDSAPDWNCPCKVHSGRIATDRKQCWILTDNS